MIYLLLLTALSAMADDGKLAGRVIGSTETVDYSTFNKSTSVNTREMAFRTSSRGWGGPRGTTCTVRSA